MPSTNSQPNRPRTRSMSLSEGGMESEPVELKTESKKRNKNRDDDAEEPKSSSKSKDKHKSKESSCREESEEKKSSKRRRHEDEDNEEEEKERHSSDKKQKSKKMKLDKEAEVSESEKEEEPAEEEEEEEEQKLSVKTTPVSKFDMSEQTKKVLEKRGIKSLFEIQTLTYQPILDGKDVVGRARTGQGKTLAYCLPIIESMLRKKHDSSKRGRPCSVLILAPTRELAIQIANEFVSVAPHLQSCAVYGGSAYDPQIRALRDGVDAVIGTPGRVCDLIDRGNLRLDALKYLVLDEADQMLDMGFQDEMNKVFEATGSGADGLQTLLFSATLPSWVKSVAMKRMKAPVTTVDLIGEGDVKASTDVDHMCMMSTPQINERAKVINDLLQVYGNLAGDGRAIVFCATKKHCDELATNENLHIEVKAMHGDVMQASRERTLAAFRRGQIKVLVATDVAARGLDIQGVDLVINNGPPAGNLSKRVDAESYVHRSGRTGRAGRKGSCITLFGPFDEHMIKDIERETGNTLRRIAAPQPKDMMIAAAKAASEAIEDVPEQITELFAESAQTLMEKMDGDATRTIAACLARLTGFSDLSSVRPRSLLQSAEGYITVQFATRSGKELNGKGLVFASLRNLLGEEAVGDNAVRGLCLTKDSTAALFDLNSKFEKPLREAMKARMRGADEFSFPSELPDLQATTTGGGGGGGRGGRGGGGYSGRGGSFHPGRGFFGGRGGIGRGGGGGGGFRGGGNSRFSSRGGGRDRDY